MQTLSPKSIMQQKSTGEIIPLDPANKIGDASSVVNGATIGANATAIGNASAVLYGNGANLSNLPVSVLDAGRTKALAAMSIIRALIAGSVTFSTGFIEGYGEAYIDNDGRNNSVVTANTTARFDTNKYKFFPNAASATTEDSDTGTTNTTYSLNLTSVITIGSTKGIISKIVFQNPFASIGYTIRIKNAAETETIATITGTTGGAGSSNTVNIPLTAYSRVLQNETIHVIFTGDSGNYCVNYHDNFSFTKTYFSMSSSKGLYNGYFTFNLTPDVTENYIEHTIPSGKFPSNISKAFAACMIKDWEIGDDIKFKFQNATEDSGWLNMGSSPSDQSFTPAFTSEPTKLIIKIMCKSSSPTAYYPSINGVYYDASA